MDTIIAKCRKLISIPFPFSILQPQSQINKCNNEKRRREQENEYIEQLGEFIHINKRDMNAPKPDKAAILNEVVKHVSRCGFVFFIGFQFCGLFLYRKLHMRKSMKIKQTFSPSTPSSPSSLSMANESIYAYASRHTK